MKVLVATQEGQKVRNNDFSFTDEGELVSFPAMQCDGERPDGGCGCRRSLSGLKSLKATTTMRVASRGIDPMKGRCRMIVVKRTFEAAKHPKDSTERKRLNLDWLTSEYMPSHRYGLRNDDGSHTPFTYRTKQDALTALAGKE